jgi:ubiquinone/menaquinone biosynthesis C-methylase UbiE
MKEGGRTLSSACTVKDLKSDIKEYWNTIPCGWTHSTREKGTREFFDEVERHRYFVEPHIREVAQFPEHKGKRLLEVGVGLGTDHRQFVLNGVRTVGIDLTPRAIQMTRQRLNLHGLTSNLCNTDAEKLPFKEDSFDVVYSFGVLLCTPNTDIAIQEIHRVLRPGGKAIVMLYSKLSVKYLYDILFKKGILEGGLLKTSPASLLNYYSEANPDSPMIKVYTKSDCRRLFQRFQSKDIRKYYIYRWREQEYKRKEYVPRFLYRSLPAKAFSWLERHLGWHMVITAIK